MATPMNRDQYLEWLRRKMREAVKETQRLDAKWNRLNDELNDHYERHGVTDVNALAVAKSESLALSDAFGAGQWWREKSVYLASVLQAELAMREAGL
jgi:hypothetical protein